MIGSYGPVFCMAAKKYLKEGGREFCVSAEFEPEMQCILVDFEPNEVLFKVSEGHLFPLLVAPQEPALTRRTPVLSSENLFPPAGRSPRARPHKEDTSVASPVSGRHWCGLASVCADPGSLACHMLGPAGCAVCIPCCPLIATFLAEDVYFYAPVAQLYVSPCLMCHFPLLSQVK